MTLNKINNIIKNFTEDSIFLAALMTAMMVVYFIMPTTFVWVYVWTLAAFAMSFSASAYILDECKFFLVKENKK